VTLLVIPGTFSRSHSASSLDTRTVEVIDKMKQMWSTVIGWMQESCANEED
jgi:hypothetical protein